MQGRQVMHATAWRSAVSLAPGRVRDRRVQRRSYTAHVQSPTNGATASNEGKKIFRTVEVDGVQYVAVKQAKDYVFQTEPDAVMTSTTVQLLQQKLDQVQEALRKKEEEAVSLRKGSMESERASRKQMAEKSELEGEIGTLRTKISNANADAKKAREEADTAMDVARTTVHKELSQKFLSSRDQQLEKMHAAVEEAMRRLQAAEADSTKRVRVSETAVVEAAAGGAEKVNSEAAEAIALARGRVEVSEKAALATQAAARQAQLAQLETAELAERLFSEAAAAADLAAAAHGESKALQEEVQALRMQVVAAVEQRDSGLRVAARRQAEAVHHIRTTHEMCEHRVQEAQNEFERLKLAERDGARRARDDTERANQRCQELEERERELMRNQGNMQEALAQLGARAEAAESKLQTRMQELQAEHDELVQLLRTNAAASLEVAKAQALDESRMVAQDMIDAAETEREKIKAAVETEKQNLEKLLESVREELQYWQQRAARTEQAAEALQRDVLAMSRALPDDMAAMQLAVEGKLTRTLIERAANGLDEIVALDDEWLPPLEGDGSEQ